MIRYFVDQQRINENPRLAVNIVMADKATHASQTLNSLQVFRCTHVELLKKKVLSSCTTTELSKLLTSCLTAVKNHVIRYCEKVYERSGKNLFWSIKNSGEVLNKLKSRGFRATSLSTYDFSTFYTTLPHNLIKEKLINLIEWTFKREGSPYIDCNERQAFFTSEDTKRYKLWSCQNACEALIFG